MYIVIGCWFYIIRPSVQSLFFALSPYFSLCLCYFELSLYCKASNNNNNNNDVYNILILLLEMTFWATVVIFILFEYSCAKLALVHKNLVFHPYGM